MFTLFHLRWLDTVLDKLSCSLLDILIFRTVNFKYACVELLMYFSIWSFKLVQFWWPMLRCWGNTRIWNSLKNDILCCVGQKEARWPPIFFTVLCYKQRRLTLCKILKNLITPNIFKLRKCCFLEKKLFGIIEFFISCIIQDFCGAILHAKFEYRSPYKIRRYIADSFF